MSFDAPFQLDEIRFGEIVAARFHVRLQSDQFIPSSSSIGKRIQQHSVLGGHKSSLQFDTSCKSRAELEGIAHRFANIVPAPTSVRGREAVTYTDEGVSPMSVPGSAASLSPSLAEINGLQQSAATSTVRVAVVLSGGGLRGAGHVGG